MRLKLVLFIACIGFCSIQANANNVQITDKVTVAGKLGKDTLMLSFPVRWDNSWRVGENWDAVYVFLKYKRADVDEPWRHLCIKDNGNRVDAGYSWAMAKTDNYGVGMFIFRSTNGTGRASTMVRVKVDISQGDLQPYYKATYEDFKNGKIDISVAAVEMVFIPRGPFYVGDNFSANSFVSESKDPYLVSSEAAQTVHTKNGITNDLGLKAELSSLYPKGYEGFYCMKYELSQEQYVYFLNKLSYPEQKRRVGNDLDKLSDGDYVFGDRTRVDKRNGIMMERRRGAGLPVLFGHNLNQDDGVYNASADGKTVACNYLTPADATAYADWTGLRLMTEMEYEKACRLRNPQIMPSAFQYAWNGQTLTPPTSGLVSGTQGTIKEVTAGDANANTLNKYNGPLRCGSFAREGTTFMSVTGATYWGCFDMTGNVAEMCYNVMEGKDMIGVSGDGSLLSEPVSWTHDTVVHWNGTISVPPYTDKVTVIRALGTRFTGRYGETVYAQDTFTIATESKAKGYSQGYGVTRRVVIPVIAWPDSLAAFGTRGGNFATASNYEATVSSRTNYRFYSGKRDRDPGSGFRLVWGVPFGKIRAGRIGLQNDEFCDTTVLCAASPYVIKELDPGSADASTVLYEWEENRGAGWVPVKDEAGVTLTLTQHWNTGTAIASRKYRRKSTSPVGEGYSNEVTLALVGVPRIEPIQVSIDMCNKVAHATGIVDMMADSILWLRKDKGTLLGNKVTDAKQSVYTPTRAEFPVSGNYEIICRAYVSGCPLDGKGMANIENPVGAAACPATVQFEGTTYHGKIMADCRCWLMEPSHTKTHSSKDAPGGGGIQMYNYEDLAFEYSSSMESLSLICPPDFYVATEWQVRNLAGNMGSTLVPNDFKGSGPLGYFDEYSNHIPGGYYWAAIWDVDNEFNYEISNNVMTIKADGTMEVLQEVLNDNGTMIPSSGAMYFPVRCIMKK